MKWRPVKRNRRKVVSLFRREQSRQWMTEWNRLHRENAPKCGALARSTGKPCRRIAMANGRCQHHGGRTPKGDHWQKHTLPANGDAPDFEKKLARKLQDRQRAEKQRQKRVEAMTPEERERYEQWRLTHRPGSAAERVWLRQERKRNAETRKRVIEMERAEAERTSVAEPLARRIAQMERRKALLEAIATGDGIFG